MWNIESLVCVYIYIYGIAYKCADEKSENVQLKIENRICSLAVTTHTLPKYTEQILKSAL